MNEITPKALNRIWQQATAPDGGIRDAGLLLLRAVTGLMMLTQHGWGKLQSYGEKADSWADPIGLGEPTSLALAIFAEGFCAALVVLGLTTRLAAIPLVIMMLVAAGIVHWDDPFGKKEFAVLFLVPFLTLILTGVFVLRKAGGSVSFQPVLAVVVVYSLHLCGVLPVSFFLLQEVFFHVQAGQLLRYSAGLGAFSVPL